MEERLEDAWFDLSLRQLREGQVRFYRVKDFLTGKWLFKVCSDKELSKVIVKAVKCPPGRRFAQLEGNSMLFQKSEIEGMLYDIVSLTSADENDKLRRRIVGGLEEIPTIIREHYEIKPYEEATGKRAPGKNLVTLTREDDEKAMVTLFLLERAWALSTVSPEERLKAIEKEKMLKPRKRKIEINTGTLSVCPICGSEFHLIHVEKNGTEKHNLKDVKRFKTVPPEPQQV